MMLTLEEAQARLFEAVRARPAAEAERVPTFLALGRVLAQDLVSTLDVPPADNAAMDGYAMRCEDVPDAGTVLPVSQRIAAGVLGSSLQPGTAARIFTGAQVPLGADAVVMQEQCDGLENAVRINVRPTPGLAIRRRGEDVMQGAVVLPCGTRLTPQALGMAATVGAATLAVARRPKVALFSTGDELVMPGEPLKAGSIYNSNRYTLRALVEAMGGECSDMGIVPDQLDATRAALRLAAQGHDLILTSGGVSVGEEDHLKPAIAAEGRLEAWQLAIKPGKPLAFGEVRRTGDTEGTALVLGLPGNPVSSFITFLLAVRPVLLQLQGATAVQPRAISLRADFDWPRADKRREFLRVRRNDSGGLELFQNQGSGVLTSAVWADGIVDNPPGHTIHVGDQVRYLPLSEWLA
jgi:molybdopterin molybdotransferase